MKLKAILVFLIIILFAGLFWVFGSENQKIESLSLMQLIVNPEKYHGRLVRVIGVSRIGFESDGIWFSKEHYEYGIYKNSLWVVPDYNALQTTSQELEKFNGKYVLMEGVFNKDNHGHMGLNSGALEKITRFDLWEK